MDSYELTRKLTKYKNMKENVSRMINVLSRSDVTNNLSTAAYALKNNYSVDNSPNKAKDLEAQKETIYELTRKLQNISYSIDNSIRKINTDISVAKEGE